MSAHREAIVVGAGVSGLTCGLRLLEDGFSVTLVARALSPHTTSDRAAAIWYPYRVEAGGRALGWARRSFEIFERLSHVPGSGVSFTELVEVFEEAVDPPAWSPAVREFRILTDREVPAGYRHGHAARLPLIETPIYMRGLENRFEALGGRIEVRDVGDLRELLVPSGRSSTGGEPEALRAGLPTLVNCAGLGARELCRDERLFPIRGQVVRTRNPGLERCLADDRDPIAPTYIVPRSEDCILGGTAVDNDWSEAVDEDTSAAILRRCQSLEPRLRGAEVLDAAVGLRPGRDEVRLEAEPLEGGGFVVHNYGHGGAGFTLSWGCAEEVVKLARDMMRAPGSAALGRRTADADA